MRLILRLLGVCVLLVVFAIGAVFFLPKDRIAAIAADQVRAQTGRELVLSGDLSLSFWPVLGVSTGPVTLSNADWAGAEPMVSAQSLSIGVDAAALIGGDIRIKHIEADQPIVRLATRADGTGNWDFGPSTPGAGNAEATGSSSAFTLERLRVSDATLVYAAAGAQPVTFAGVTATLDWPDPAAGAAFAVVLDMGSGPLELDGTIDSFAAFLDGQVAPITVEGRTKGGSFGFAGRANMTGEAAGRATLKTSDTAAFLTSLGAAGGTDVPEGLGKTIDAAADVTFTAGNRLAARDLSLGLDSNRLTGAADVILSEVPQITAQLSAGALDFSALSVGNDDTSGQDGAGGSGWSQDPIDASALGLLNANVSLAAESIDLGTVQLGASQLGVTVDRSRAVLQLKQVAVFDGAISGQLVANNRNGLSVGGNLSVSQVELEQVLTDLAGITRLSGKTDAQVEFLGVGQSTDAIMRSLSGGGSLSTGRGVIGGIDLDRLMRTGDGSGGTTVFDSLTASFNMQNGNLVNDDLLLLLANFRAEGAGRIGLGSQDIDYVFTPIALRANSGQGLAIPIQIRGPWSAPRIVPDLAAALQLDVDGKVEEVKRDAREQVEKKLQEELGVTVEEGQSTEDAIKDALEDRAKDRLRQLLGGD